MAFFQTDNLRVEAMDSGTALLTLDVAGRSMNVFTRQLLADFDAALDHVSRESQFRLLVIRSGKPTGFVAGADLHEFTAVQGPDDATALSATGQRLFDKLAAMPQPVIAVIGGVCLGGGLELALACDYRLVVDVPGTLIGLPEIEIGLIPGWGGTQRLPYIVGLERALQVILASRRLDAAAARRWGLADRSVPAQGELPAPVVCELAQGLAWQGKRTRTKLPVLTWRQRILESTAFGRRVIFGAAERVLRRRVPDDMPAPREALEAVRVGIKNGREAGLAYERQAIGRLATTAACRNLIRLFFEREAARKQSDVAKREADKVRRIGIVGVGTMGAGIAQLCAIRGIEVVIQEASFDALGAGLMKIDSLFKKAVERRILTAEEAAKRISNIRHATTTWEGFDTADLVIEAALEDPEVKRGIFRELEKRTKPGTILATNTSSLSVQSLIDGMVHPQRVAGMHFFNPVHKMPLVEVVRAPATVDRAAETVAALATKLGKTPLVVKDSPGFVVNRILMPYLNEAVLLVVEGMSPRRIDHVMTRFGMPMGPLELLDQVGIDVAAHIARVMQPLTEKRFPPNPYFDLMVRTGYLGQKNRRGFYRHGRRRVRENDLAVNLLRAEMPDSPLRSLPHGMQMQRARERMVLVMVNEAAACLGEGLADAPTIDLAMVMGTGWAPHRGGPLRYAQDRGIENVMQALNELARTVGPRFVPCPELGRLAGQMSV